MYLFDLSLYLVTDSSLLNGRSLEEVAVAAVEGGVTMVQLREKECSTLEFYNLALRMKACLKPYKVPLIINDRLDIALACDAEGLHIGQNDMPYQIARQLLGQNKIIGLSVENTQDVVDANSLDIDYIGISPVFNTMTKTDTAPALGLDGVKELTRISKHPSVGIGGINLSNSRDVILSGANGVSVVSAIMSSVDPKQSAQQLMDIVNQSKI